MSSPNLHLLVPLVKKKGREREGGGGRKPDSFPHLTYGSSQGQGAQGVGISLRRSNRILWNRCVRTQYISLKLGTLGSRIIFFIIGFDPSLKSRKKPTG